MSNFSFLPRSWVQRAIQIYRLARSAQTLGVRCVVQDEAGRLLLVRHNYLPGWYLPGGAVDAGETIFAAAKRELEEETGLLATHSELISVHLNARGLGRDHVALIRLTDWQRVREVKVPNREIAEIGFFAIDDLPRETTGATRARLAELLGQVPIAERW